MWKQIEADREEIRKHAEEWEKEHAQERPEDEEAIETPEPEASGQGEGVYITLLDDKPISGQMTFDDYLPNT